MNDQEARAFVARLTDIDLDRIESALNEERESRKRAALRAVRDGLAVSFAS